MLNWGDLLPSENSKTAVVHLQEVNAPLKMRSSIAEFDKVNVCETIPPLILISPQSFSNGWMGAISPELLAPAKEVFWVYETRKIKTILSIHTIFFIGIISHPKSYS
jgi:hypothetical protein